MAHCKSLVKFENSLKEYLINALSDKYGSVSYYANRFHNLKVYIDPTRVKEPHFFVSVGISEACFPLAAGKHSIGSVGDEDRYIKRWSERLNINKELRKQWQIINDECQTEDDIKKSLDEEVQRRTNRINSLQVDMTGTGINKAKRLELEQKQKNLINFPDEYIEEE